MFRRFSILLIFVLMLMLLVPQAVGASDCGTHVVQRGENLFRISLRYNVKLTTLAAFNNIWNIHQIYAGQVLHIPCSGSTQTTNQPANNNYNTPTYNTPTYNPWTPTNTYHPTVNGLNCAGFRATSPVDGFPNGNVMFYWDPPVSHDQIARYQVRILNAAGYEVGAYETLNIGTSLRADVSVGAIGPGNNFAWYAVGVTADERLCRTQVVHLPREWTQ